MSTSLTNKFCFFLDGLYEKNIRSHQNLREVSGISLVKIIHHYLMVIIIIIIIIIVIIIKKK